MTRESQGYRGSAEQAHPQTKQRKHSRGSTECWMLVGGSKCTDGPSKAQRLMGNTDVTTACPRFERENNDNDLPAATLNSKSLLPTRKSQQNKVGLKIWKSDLTEIQLFLYLYIFIVSVFI